VRIECFGGPRDGLVIEWRNAQKEIPGWITFFRSDSPPDPHPAPEFVRRHFYRVEKMGDRVLARYRGLGSGNTPPAC